MMMMMMTMKGRNGAGWSARGQSGRERSENMPVVNIHNEEVYDNFAVEGEQER